MGTSSGASVLAETMLVSGNGNTSPDVDEIASMAPGLGFVPGVVIDQHFAERGRIGRLIGSIVQNPRLLGVGIDEDTAVSFSGEEATIIGSGSVYAIDARHVSYTNLTEAEHRKVSAHSVRVHLLTAGDRFDLRTRTPNPPG